MKLIEDFKIVNQRLKDNLSFITYMFVLLLILILSPIIILSRFITWIILKIKK